MIWWRPCSKWAFGKRLKLRLTLFIPVGKIYTVYLKLFRTLLLSTYFHMCLFIFLMPSVKIYNVNSHENRENALNEVSTNYWPLPYFNYSLKCWLYLAYQNLK